MFFSCKATLANGHVCSSLRTGQLYKYIQTEPDQIDQPDLLDKPELPDLLNKPDTARPAGALTIPKPEDIHHRPPEPTSNHTGVSNSIKSVSY